MLDPDDVSRSRSEEAPPLSAVAAAPEAAAPAPTVASPGPRPWPDRPLRLSDAEARRILASMQHAAPDAQWPLEFHPSYTKSGVSRHRWEALESPAQSQS